MAYKGFGINYLRKKGYQRLNESGGRRRRNRAQLGRNKRFWGIKIVPKVRLMFKRASPKGFFVWLRDAYVNMMLNLANSRSLTTGYGGGFTDGRSAFGKGGSSIKEYDERMIVEIYKSILMAQGHLMPREAARLAR
ncbi:hypothetical protein ACFE04_017497 [Oxalis oulophora]